MTLSDTITLPSDPHRKSACGREGTAMLLGNKLFPGRRNDGSHFVSLEMASQIRRNSENDTGLGHNFFFNAPGHFIAKTRTESIHVLLQTSQ
jgi:hypothetical protein